MVNDNCTRTLALFVDIGPMNSENKRIKHNENLKRLIEQPEFVHVQPLLCALRQQITDGIHRSIGNFSICKWGQFNLFQLSRKLLRSENASR